MVRLKIQKSKGSIIYSMDDLLNFFFLEFRTISIDRRKEGKNERGKECLVDR